MSHLCFQRSLTPLACLQHAKGLQKLVVGIYPSDNPTSYLTCSNLRKLELNYPTIIAFQTSLNMDKNAKALNIAHTDVMIINL